MATIKATSLIWFLMVSPLVAADESPHGLLRLPCSACHSSGSWRVDGSPPGFDHALVGHPLEGAHRSVACAGCHRDLVFSRVGTSCLDCHADVHEGDLGTDCRHCHLSESWTLRRAAVELHLATRFPLVGVHATQDCDACHRSALSGDFGDTPVACDGCHLALYDATADPPHAAAGFGVRCDECHSPASRDWSESSWNHDPLFPIESGAHDGRWTQCSDCHTQPTSFSLFECTFCHEHSRASMAEHHREVGGYGYESQACYNCHPRGLSE